MTSIRFTEVVEDRLADVKLNFSQKQITCISCYLLGFETIENLGGYVFFIFNFYLVCIF